MPLALVAKVVTDNAIVLGTALGLGLGAGLVCVCCLGILISAGTLAAIGLNRQRQVQQHHAKSQQAHQFANLLRKALHFKGVADFNSPAGKAYVAQINYLTTYDEVLMRLYIRSSNDDQLPALAKELAKVIRLHFKQQGIALQPHLLQKETPAIVQVFYQQYSFLTEALNRGMQQGLLPIELEEVKIKRTLNPPAETFEEVSEVEIQHTV